MKQHVGNLKHDLGIGGADDCHMFSPKLVQFGLLNWETLRSSVLSVSLLNQRLRRALPYCVVIWRVAALWIPDAKIHFRSNPNVGRAQIFNL